MHNKLASLGGLVALNVGALLGAAGQLLGTFVFNDIAFLGYLLVAVGLDTISGFWASLVLKTHSSNKLRQVFSKLGQYGIALVAVHALTSFKVGGEANLFVQYIAPSFKGAVYTLMMWAETLSIEENLNKLGRGFLPKWVRRKMEAWTESGELPNADKPADPAASSTSDAS